MALKPITRQEQIIVGKNLEPITRMERFLKEYGGGTGGSAQSDWNQTDSSAADFIKNKPFGDMPTGGDTLYWDGNTEGLEQFQSVFYKASDAVPTMADFSNGAYIYTNTGEYMEVPADLITDDGTGVIIFDAFVVVYGELDGMPKGTYLMNMNGMYVSALTIPGYTGFPVTKKMDEKYLPGAVILYVDDSMTYLYATSDTSDTSKRMTRAELMDRMMNGSTLYLYIDVGTYKQCIACRTVTDFGEYGSVSITVNLNGTDMTASLYTAEYTAS